MKLLPNDRPKNAFYFQPLKKPSADVWFSNRPIGHNTLDQTVARLCSMAGITGFRTNHSLRSTTATRLYQAGVDEQLIMETTGHRSLEGVRSYKRTSLVSLPNQPATQHIHTSQTAYNMPPTLTLRIVQ